MGKIGAQNCTKIASSLGKWNSYRKHLFLLKLQTGEWFKEKYILCVLRMNTKIKQLVYSLPTWKGMTVLLHVLYTFICFNKKVQHLCFLFWKPWNKICTGVSLNKIMPRSVSGKWKANENKTNKITELEGREALEMNSSILKQCFRLLVYS